MWDQIDVPVVAEGIRLNAPDRLFYETDGQRILANDKFIRSLSIFNARPDVIASVKTNG